MKLRQTVMSRSFSTETNTFGHLHKYADNIEKTKINAQKYLGYEFTQLANSLQNNSYVVKKENYRPHTKTRIFDFTYYALRDNLSFYRFTALSSLYGLYRFTYIIQP